MTDRPSVAGLDPVATHNTVLAAYRADMELFADLFGPRRRFGRGGRPVEPVVSAGRRRILERHEPTVLAVTPLVVMVWCARCSGPYNGLRTVGWPCMDYVDAAGNLVDGLTAAETGVPA